MPSLPAPRAAIVTRTSCLRVSFGSSFFFPLPVSTTASGEAEGLGASLRMARKRKGDQKVTVKTNLPGSWTSTPFKD